jgi:acyl-CoA synthetase (AMP-forming)/AMP-acid ligase II
MAQVLIHDETRGILPDGEVGEIIVRGPFAFSHYVNNPAATEAARIRVNGADWYRSGDIGEICSDGSLRILDRQKDMIICGGENIYSAEVEGALALHPEVVEVSVVGRHDEKWGEIVVAFVVLRERATRPTLEDMRIACSSLASYKHPKEIFFVHALPRNSFGKVQKPKLKLMTATITQELIDAENYTFV